MILLSIFLAGGLGSLCRYGLGALVNGRMHAEFPWGTLAVNILGCIAIGLIGKFFLHSQTQVAMRATLIVGFCGGFTTFSSFSYETIGLLQAGHWPKAAAYIAASVVVCLAGTALGFSLGPTLNP